MKCVNCKNCIGFEEGYYLCQLEWSDGTEWEYVPECIANDDNMECGCYVNNDDDDITA